MTHGSGRFDVFRELVRFVFENKSWWLGTIVLLLGLLGLLVAFTQGTALAPFIYALF